MLLLERHPLSDLTVHHRARVGCGGARVLGGARLHAKQAVSEDGICASSYQNRSALEGQAVIEQVLADYPYPADKRLIETYPVRDYSVQ